jgi:hypothetical protein
MIQGSTPVLTVRVKDKDLTTAQRIRLTIGQHGTPHNFDKARLTAVTDEADTLLLLHLTQQETLALDPGRVGIQVRWQDSYGEWHTTKPAIIAHFEAYCKEVLT